MYECQLCGNTDAYIHFGTELLCLDCYNEKMFKKLGVKATSYPEGVTIRDGEGKVHRLRLRKRLDPIGIIMEANAEESDGYQFIVHGELDVDQDELFLQLIAKAERGMAEKYVEQGQFPNGQSYNTMKNNRLAGIIAYNPDEDVVPKLVVDGKSYTWDEIGKMVMVYEGFQIKLETLDPSDEIEWENKR
ncbi:DUF7713 domain-containing protein [Paenisporosarcina sp. TG-14]|uniref:DUF7713 domain-containing protein n=1 Tax=Paenisporosarcina sp. TG-14 TaxID=1231057 RepID=UPI00030FE807|nr:hypothetical protein [Paenisporosarcina sp. TG-14]